MKALSIQRGSGPFDFPDTGFEMIKLCQASPGLNREPIEIFFWIWPLIGIGSNLSYWVSYRSSFLT